MSNKNAVTGTYYFKHYHNGPELQLRGPWSQEVILALSDIMSCDCCPPAWRGDDGSKKGIYFDPPAEPSPNEEAVWGDNLESE